MITQLTTGNINTTYLLTIEYEKGNQRAILQMINGQVFSNPAQVLANSVLILNYLNDNTLFYLKTLSGENYYIDNAGNYWRVFNYVSNSLTVHNTNDLHLVEQTGKAFGNFIKRLVEFDANQLHVTIPDFHNTIKRFETFKKCCKQSSTRFKRIERECNLIFALENKACLLQSMINDKNLPIRVTHNDTKCSNVLFDKVSKNYLAVIDLDTVMPGAVAHDFGDSARSICSKVKEDESDYDKVGFDLEKFYFYSKGFLEEIKQVLCETEKQTLYLGVLTITVELAVRFFTDYLQNDVYFHIDYPEHNRIRATNQLVLALDVFDKIEEIKKITYEFLY